MRGSDFDNLGIQLIWREMWIRLGLIAGGAFGGFLIGWFTRGFWI